MFGWNIFVYNFTYGGQKGYSVDSFIVKLNLPFSYGEFSGPKS